jgi:hypothetical protein
MDSPTALVDEEICLCTRDTKKNNNILQNPEEKNTSWTVQSKTGG